MCVHPCTYVKFKRHKNRENKNNNRQVGCVTPPCRRRIARPSTPEPPAIPSTKLHNGTSTPPPFTYRWSRRFYVSCARWPCSTTRPLACSPAASADSFAIKVSFSLVPIGIYSRPCAVESRPTGKKTKRKLNHRKMYATKHMEGKPRWKGQAGRTTPLWTFAVYRP